MSDPSRTSTPSSPAVPGGPVVPGRRRQVVVVGAGPTGLLLAGDLAAAGVDTVVLERRGTTSNLTRAFAVHARTLEVLDARGLADDLVAAGRPVAGLRLFARVRVDLGRLPSRFPFLLVVPQYTLEELLEARARQHGAQFLTGLEVVGLRQDADTVTVTARDRAGRRHEVGADHVVGCDGAHSAVRRLLGVPFPGSSAVRSVMLGDVRLADVPPDVLTVDAGPDGFAFLAPFGDGWYRVIAWDRSDEQPDDAPVGIDALRDITRRVLGTDHGMSDPRWTSRFSSDERQVPGYRTGRVLLAGDAAHVHSPAGGQGMNTGLQDAANLSWKLAAVATGRAPDAVLDSYQRERHPVGRRVLQMSSALLRLAMLTGPAGRWARDHLGVALTRFRPTADRIAGRVSGLDVAYPGPRAGGRRVGARVGDQRVTTADGSRQRLYETLRAGRFVVVLPAGDPLPDPAAWPGDVVVVVGEEPAADCLLVRPDGHLAAAVPTRDTAGRVRAVAAALTPWLGALSRQR